ncbi:MAG: rhodanese-like domain-containing protein [Chloroflexi bacterium]|nr:rhodanese-like domain-containing protein [Chloroflexota bacterium]
MSDLPLTISPVAASALLAEPDAPLLIDVREETEWNEVHIPGAILIPLSQFVARQDEIPVGRALIMQCRSGGRSGQAALALRTAGRANVANLVDGIIDWEAAGLPVVYGE